MKKVVYLYKSGNLKRKDNSLVLESKDKDDYIPIEQVDMIICFSEVSLNKRVLALLNKYEVSILFYNFYGNYIGRYAPKDYKDGRVLCISPNRDIFNSKYLEYFMRIKTLVEYPKLGSGSTFAEFKIFLLKDMDVLVPPRNVQNQFADFVTSIDKSK